MHRASPAERAADRSRRARRVREAARAPADRARRRCRRRRGSASARPTRRTRSTTSRSHRSTRAGRTASSSIRAMRTSSTWRSRAAACGSRSTSSSANPTWAPTMDLLPNLAVGALALDPDHPDTLYVGNGDFVDAIGRHDPEVDRRRRHVERAGRARRHVLERLQVGAGRRSGRSASKGNLVLAATDAGLLRVERCAARRSRSSIFRTARRACSPSRCGASLRSAAARGSRAGVTACAPGAPPPIVYFGSNPSAQDARPATTPRCGAPTTARRGRRSRRRRALLGTGRTTLAVGATDDPAHTRVYAFVGDIDGTRRSATGAPTTAAARTSTRRGTLANPTLAANMDDACTDIDVGHGQTWYNQAIVVDPTNPDHVLVGGNLCGMRTLNGTAASPTWELVSHWLPGPGFGETANGRLVVRPRRLAHRDVDRRRRSRHDVRRHRRRHVRDHEPVRHRRPRPSRSCGRTATGPRDAPPLLGRLRRSGDRRSVRRVHGPAGQRHAVPRRPARPVGVQPADRRRRHRRDRPPLEPAGTTYWAIGRVRPRVLQAAPRSTARRELPEAPDDASSHWHTSPSPIASPSDEQLEANRIAQRADLGEDRGAVLRALRRSSRPTRPARAC